TGRSRRSRGTSRCARTRAAKRCRRRASPRQENTAAEASSSRRIPLSPPAVYTSSMRYGVLVLGALWACEPDSRHPGVERGPMPEGDLPPILDWEVTDNVSNAVDVSEVQDFVDEVHARTGLTTILYTSARFLGTVGNPTQFGNLLPLWDANWNVSCPNIPSSWTKWTFWQNADNGVIPGINGGVDTNYFNGTLAQLQAMTGPG